MEAEVKAPETMSKHYLLLRQHHTLHPHVLVVGAAVGSIRKRRLRNPKAGQTLVDLELHEAVRHLAGAEAEEL